MAITAYATYLLEITYTCSDDDSIHCFPLLINPNNSELTIPELTEPIDNCTEWTNSPNVTFQCFRYAYNSNAALAVAGGLLALFTYVMRTTISIITKVFNWCCHNCCLTVLQYVVAYVTIFIDVAIAFIVMSLVLVRGSGAIESLEDPVARTALSYVAEHGVQIVISTGTIALLLLIKYTDEECCATCCKTDTPRGDIGMNCMQS